MFHYHFTPAVNNYYEENLHPYFKSNIYKLGLLAKLLITRVNSHGVSELGRAVQCHN